MALESKAVAYLTDIKILTFIPSPLKSRQDASCSKNKYKKYLIWTYFTETNCSVFDIFKIQDEILRCNFKFLSKLFTHFSRRVKSAKKKPITYGQKHREG